MDVWPFGYDLWIVADYVGCVCVYCVCYSFLSVVYSAWYLVLEGGLYCFRLVEHCRFTGFGCIDACLVCRRWVSVFRRVRGIV